VSQLNDPQVSETIRFMSLHNGSPTQSHIHQEIAMSQAHIEQFYSKAVKDPAIINSIFSGATGPKDFAQSAVKIGKQNGFDFTAAEADAWITKQQEIKAKGELSDSQLESVAGGKGNSTSTNLQNQANANSNIATDPTKSLGQQFVAGVSTVGQQWGAWLTSW
jgi:hypothetical protein